MQMAGIEVKSKDCERQLGLLFRETEGIERYVVKFLRVCRSNAVNLDEQKET